MPPGVFKWTARQSRHRYGTLVSRGEGYWGKGGADVSGSGRRLLMGVVGRVGAERGGIGGSGGRGEGVLVGVGVASGCRRE